MYQSILQYYQAESPRQPATNELHDGVGSRLPRTIHDLWDDAGLGKLKEGMLELIDPDLYISALTPFFGGELHHRIPFMLNAFGEPVLYKRVSAREAEISILHTYGPKLEVLAYSLSDFFDRIMLTDDGLRQLVNVHLFNELKNKLRRLKSGQSYGFDPLLLQEEQQANPEKKIKADASWFEIVDTREHWDKLLAWAENN